MENERVMNLVLANSCFGNCVGIISLVIGIISLVITVKTYHKTKSIEKKLPEEKAKAIDKLVFQRYKETALNTLKNRNNSAQMAKRVSKKAFKEIIAICKRLENFKNGLNDDDLQRVESICDECEAIYMCELCDKEDRTVPFLSITAELISILEKGEYAI